MSSPTLPRQGLKRLLPAVGSPAYHVMLGCVALLVLGPLGGYAGGLAALSVGLYGLLRTLL